MTSMSLAKMYANKDDEIVELLSEAEGGVARAKTLTQQLITFSKGGAPVKQILDISESSPT